jgi:branched-chain amino acid transport system substrate-binding protein
MRMQRALACVAAIAALLVLAGPGKAAERGPVKIGLLVPLTGGAAQIGADMRNGFMMAIEDAKAQAGGRRIEVIIEDDEANPAQSLTKTRKMVESDRVHVVAGTLLASSCYAVAPYLNEKRVPYFSLCAADDLTQRKPSPVLVRTSWSSSQDSHPFGEYMAKTLRYKRVATMGADYAFGWEVIGGVQRTFEENGGQIVQKIWVPLNAQDFAPYLSQIKRDVDAVYMMFFGAQALRAVKQYQEFGLKAKIPLSGGGVFMDESVLPSMGDEALGVITHLHYSAALDIPTNKRFVAAYRPRYGKVPSYYSANLYVIAQAIMEAAKAVDGDVEDAARFIAAGRKVKLPDTPRGPVELDETGNAIHNVYIKKVERAGGELQNTVIYTYPRVSQFWKYNKEEYLKQPVYDRNNPPCRYCQ